MHFNKKEVDAYIKNDETFCRFKWHVKKPYSLPTPLLQGPFCFLAEFS